jgi:hypothetical protein
VTTPQETNPQSGAQESSTETKHEPERRALTLAPATTRTSGAFTLHLSVLPEEGDHPAARPIPRLQKMGNVIIGTMGGIRAILNRRRAQIAPAAPTLTLERMPPVINRHIARFLGKQDEKALGAASQLQRGLLEPIVASRMRLLNAVESLNNKYDRLYLRHAQLRVEHEILDARNRGVDPHSLGPVQSQRAYRMEFLERRKLDSAQSSDSKLNAVGRELSDLEVNLRMNCMAIAIARKDWNGLNVEAEMPRAKQPRDPFEKE